MNRFSFLLPWVARLGASLAVVSLLALNPGAYISQRGRTPEEKVTLGPQQQVQTTDDRVCLHTRATDEVDEGKIKRTFEMAREMGAGTVVEYLPWAYVEGSSGEYDWSHPDRILKHIERQGLKPIIRIGYVPDWLRPDEDSVGYTNANYLTDEMLDAYADYVGVFVEHYRGRVDTIIIWNEPNLNMEWTAGGSDPVGYTELLKKAYTAAKAANPDVMVLGGALAPTNEPPHGAGGWNDIDFLNEMYEAGAAPYFDALAAHTYGFNQPPQAEADIESLNFRRLELLREVMVKHGDADKDVYITEGGWNDHPRWIHGVRPGQRIVYTLDAYTYAKENMPWLKSFCLWAFRYPVPTNSYPDYFTYVSPLFDPKPIYLALQAYARGWEMPEWLSSPE
jgi:polysaccharide biosynthesis protein PslG